MINFVSLGTSFDAVVYNGVNIDSVVWNSGSVRTEVWSSFNTKLLDNDFIYTKSTSPNKVAYITSWKGTYNGEVSTSCIIPDIPTGDIDITSLNYRSYANLTNINIPTNITTNSRNFQNRFSNLRNLTSVNMNASTVGNASRMFQN